MQTKHKNHKLNKNDESAFNYTLELKPDGKIKIKDSSGKILKSKGVTKHPKIKKIIDVRTLTIIEAEGCQWIYLKPPGRWYRLS
ncbi:MAG: hypothetical protein KZQ99_07180 [Candidatus Thiodiazotropha sp. (ex Dulcina madagascariensis)]|nr:hypothetical protein [Candidatus Thiodiazotropha sp. (ex Dulcina madagascariensis)]